MQIHLALTSLRAGTGDERLARTAIVHVTPGLDGVSRAVNEAERGTPPGRGDDRRRPAVRRRLRRARPTASRSSGSSCRSCPAGPVKGDAAGELDVGDGSWTEALREAYADRIVARLGEPHPESRRATLKRVTLSPVDIEALNVNLVGGDIYGGSCALDQNFLFRPFAAQPGHFTRVEGLWHVGAIDAPGPGSRRRLGLPRLQGADEARRSHGVSLQSFQDAREALLLGDLDRQRVVRGRRPRLRCGRVRRDRPLGDEAAGRRRGEPGTARGARPRRLELRADRAVVLPARDPRDGRDLPTPASGSKRSASRSSGSPPTSRSACSS